MTNCTQLNQKHVLKVKRRCDMVLFKNEMGGKNGFVLSLSRRFLHNSSACCIHILGSSCLCIVYIFNKLYTKFWLFISLSSSSHVKSFLWWRKRKSFAREHQSFEKYFSTTCSFRGFVETFELPEKLCV